jgi:hypothetical protein
MSGYCRPDTTRAGFWEGIASQLPNLDPTGMFRRNCELAGRVLRVCDEKSEPGSQMRMTQVVRAGPSRRHLFRGEAVSKAGGEQNCSITLRAAMRTEARFRYLRWSILPS